jgi:hypothetical protein
MRDDPGITVLLTIPEALRIGGSVLRSRWTLILATWLLTGCGALLLQDLLLPARIAWSSADGEVLVPFVILLLVAQLLSLLGILVVARTSGRYALQQESGNGVKEVGKTVALFGHLLLTVVLSALRIVLVILGSLPLVILLGFLLYGAAQGTLSESVEQAVVVAPILLFAVVGFARFGWAVYFTLLDGAGPKEALRKSKSLFANNRDTVWTITGIVLVLPIVATFLPTFAGEELSRPIYRSLRYVSSLWSFAAAGLVGVIIARSREEDDTEAKAGG